MGKNIRFGPAPEHQSHAPKWTPPATQAAPAEFFFQATMRAKTNYVGAPAIFALEQACRQVCEAFDVSACYVVGSVLQRPDWRDVDVRLILDDDEFAALFPGAGQHWEHDARWLLLTVSISERLSKITGLPIDFQFQPQTHANDRHKGHRHAIGLRYAKDAPRP